MVIRPTPDRRTVLKALGTAGALAGVGTASAQERGGDPDSELRLFSEQQVGNGGHGTNEVVTQQNYAYAATGIGMAIVDWRNPGRPELAARIEASEPEEIGGGDNAGAVAVDDDDDSEADDIGDILDVKVDGDVAAMAHNAGTGITTVDVSDPENPEELAFYTTTDQTGIHNCFLYEDHAYLTVSSATVVEDDDKGIGFRIFGDTGVEIVDISDPAAPEHAATWYLRDEFPAYANAGVNPNHDVYVQDDLLYNVFWDAGCVVLDVSDPSAPEFVAQFGEAPNADEEIQPWYPSQEDYDQYLARVFPLGRYYAGEGNAHYVQPSPDGDYTYVGDEKFPNRLEDDPDTEQYGGIRIFDTSDWDDVEQVGYIEPPDEEVGLRTSHNFDVTANRIHTSWYNGGVRVHDITDPSDPEELASYNADGYSFWTAVQGRSFTIGGVYGARSDSSPGGVLALHDDRGAKRPPGFDGSDPPEGPEIEIDTDEE